MMMSSTRDFTTAPKAAPMITPIAKSTTFPLNANLLNSSNNEKALFLASLAANALTGSIGLLLREQGTGLLESRKECGTLSEQDVAHRQNVLKTAAFHQCSRIHYRHSYRHGTSTCQKGTNDVYM